MSDQRDDILLLAARTLIADVDERQHLDALADIVNTLDTMRPLVSRKRDVALDREQ